MTIRSINTSGLPQGVLDTVNQLLFDAGQVGGNLPFSDFSKIWQDSAGTTQYTAVEQYVGKIIDKSPNALAFTQATSAARPVVSARVNLLTKTEQLSEAVWVKSGLGTGSAPSVTSNAALAPDGTLTADHVTLAIGGGTSSSDWSWLYQNLPRTAGVSENFAIWVKAATPADVGRGVVLTGVSVQMVTLSAEWVRYELPAVVTNSQTFSYGVRLRGNETPGATDVSFHLWGASLTLATDAHLSYQRVNTPTDYDTAGFPNYSKFDGIDDNIVSAAGGGGTAGIYYCGAVRFNKVGAAQTIFSDAGTNSGYKLQLTAANQLQISAGNGTAFTAINTTDVFALGDVSLCELWDDGTNIGVRLGEGTPVTVARPVVTAGTAQITLGKDNNAASSYAGINMFEPVWRYGAMPNQTQREAIRAICRSKARIV